MNFFLNHAKTSEMNTHSLAKKVYANLYKHLKKIKLSFQQIDQEGREEKGRGKKGYPCGPRARLQEGRAGTRRGGLSLQRGRCHYRAGIVTAGQVAGQQTLHPRAVPAVGSGGGGGKCFI